MKCRLLKPLNVCTKTASPELLALCKTRVMSGKTRHYLEAGTVLDYPRAFVLVRHGAAVAIDEECRQHTMKTDAEIEASKQSFNRLSAKIAPEDFPLFDAGYISGYNMDGSYKPGPNWNEYLSLQQQDGPLSSGDEW